jgi:hypothetical protein
VPRSRAGPLAAWATAWLGNRVAPDDVVAAVRAGDAAHRVDGLGLDSLYEVFGAWRRTTLPGETVRLVLPVAGDVRGLPGPAEFRTAALEAGEAVCGGGLGLVPEVVDHSPSSAPTDVTWLAYAIDPTPIDHVQLTEAQYDLATAISATALSDAEVAGWVAGIAPDLQSARRAGERLNLPPGFPPRAVNLLAQAERVQAVLDLADLDPVGGAIDQHGVAAQRAALQPLAAAVRRARLAGYNAAAEVGNMD